MNKKISKNLLEYYEFLEQSVQDLVKIMDRLRKKLKKDNLWLGGGRILSLPMTDEAQEGPLVKELYSKIDSIKENIKSKENSDG